MNKLKQKVIDNKMIIGIVLTALLTISLFWFTEIDRTSLIFLIFAFVIFYYKIDSRVSIIGALFSLGLIILFSIINSLHITEYYIGGDLEKLAIYTYFFLIIGVIAQIIEYKKEVKITAKAEKESSRKSTNDLLKFLTNFDKNALKITMWLATFLSISSFLFFYFNEHWHLNYSDTYAHLNMARKIFDNLTPGFEQLGGQWLPLLHILIAPFTLNNFLWHSGIAGAIVSMPAFILSIYLIFKTIDLFFQDKKSAFLGALVYMLSINMLYLQTMAMMESLFNLTIIGSTYFISKWAIRNNVFDLVAGGAFVALSTLTRYEGYSVLIISILSVLLIAFLKRDKIGKKSIEGIFILFTIVAGVGILFWTIYLNVVFDDPFHWLHPLQELSSISIEQDTSSVDNTHEDVIAESNANNPSQITHSLFSATLFTNGAIVCSIALVGFIILLLHSSTKIKQSYHFIGLILIPISTYLFLLATTTLGNITIYGPSIFDLGIFNKWSNYAIENGMRYTLSFLPFVAFFSAIITVGNIKRQLFVFSMIILQFIFALIGPLFLTYNFAVKWKQVYTQTPQHIDYLQNNYTTGLILISTLTHDEDMFKYNISYKNYIHEGAYKYWNESLENPAKYADWIIMNNTFDKRAMGGSDILTRVFLEHPERLNNFEIVYQDEIVKIYKNLKTN